MKNRLNQWCGLICQMIFLTKNLPLQYQLAWCDCPMIYWAFDIYLNWCLLTVAICETSKYRLEGFFFFFCLFFSSLFSHRKSMGFSLLKFHLIPQNTHRFLNLFHQKIFPRCIGKSNHCCTLDMTSVTAFKNNFASLNTFYKPQIIGL